MCMDWYGCDERGVSLIKRWFTDNEKGFNSTTFYFFNCKTTMELKIVHYGQNGIPLILVVS